MFTLPDLPYDYDALAPYISEQIQQLHHDKHQQAYVDNLNKALEKYPDWQNKSIEEIREYIGADSLAYLSLDGMKRACGEGELTTYCTACYTGKYPTQWVDVDEIQPATVTSRP